MAICGPEDSVYSCGQKWRAALRQREAEAHRLLLEQYGETYQWLRDELAATLQAIEQVEGEVSPGKLWRSQRLKALLQQMDSEMARLAQVTAGETAKAQADAVNMASQAVTEMLGLAGVDFAAFPHEAFATLVGFLADGTPLAEHLAATLPAEAVGALRQSLLVGLAAGWNPRKAARYAAQKATGLALSRALTIARTEMLRSYREATRAAYERSEVVSGWIWSAAKDRRVCPACLALDCKEFPTSQPMEGHPNCRCTMLPKIEGVRYRKTCGSDWLATQPPEVQDEILGKAGGALYRAGVVELDDFRGRKRHERWGNMWQARSLKEILGDERDVWLRRYRWQQKVQAMRLNDIILAGEAPAEVLARMSAGWTREVVLTAKRRAHYIEGHPEVTRFEIRVPEAIETPDVVLRDKKRANRLHFLKFIGQRLYLRVVVHLQIVPGERAHAIVTAWVQSEYKVFRERENGLQIWP